MLPRASFRPRHGFTTIEALVAAVVFLLGLSGLLGALTQARNATGQARRYMQATDIANDLVEQIQLWRSDDPRLVPKSDVCDPLDKAGAMLKPRDNGDYTAYTKCMRDDFDIKPNDRQWSGLATPEFTDEQGITTTYWRYFMIRKHVDTTVNPAVTRLQIWVKVRYDDVGEPRVVTTQAMRIHQGL
ncbi:hypothetical protein [Cystobacter fuscus]|uniref:type IV pilus modification PilV family protein n=1 Tax=Cystobacter fuscus TaxID=43 RepID=UPI002B317B8E|nr:hypothetical protein F0U63_07490 [Cystobacter fuscus]